MKTQKLIACLLGILALFCINNALAVIVMQSGRCIYYNEDYNKKVPGEVIAWAITYEAGAYVTYSWIHTSPTAWYKIGDSNNKIKMNILADRSTVPELEWLKVKGSINRPHHNKLGLRGNNICVKNTTWKIYQDSRFPVADLEKGISRQVWVLDGELFNQPHLVCNVNNLPTIKATPLPTVIAPTSTVADLPLPPNLQKILDDEERMENGSPTCTEEGATELTTLSPGKAQSTDAKLE